MEGRLSSMQKCKALLQYQKNPRRDFLRTCQQIKSPWRGDLATCRIATQFFNTWKNPWRDFSRSYAAMEPRQYRPKGGMSVSEGRNGGGAKACPVELAMAQNGRAIRTTVLKSTVQKITVKKNASQKPNLSPSEKAQRVSKRLKINKVWYIILAKGLQKGKNGYVTL